MAVLRRARDLHGKRTMFLQQGRQGQHEPGEQAEAEEAHHACVYCRPSCTVCSREKLRRCLVDRVAIGDLPAKGVGGRVSEQARRARAIWTHSRSRAQPRAPFPSRRPFRHRPSR